jgi:hypothetical protein
MEFHETLFISYPDLAGGVHSHGICPNESEAGG